MKFFPIHLSVAFSTLFVLTACAGDPAPGTSSTTSGTAGEPVAVVNGVAIPNEFVEVIIAEQRAQGAPEDPNMKDNIRKELVRRTLLEQDAVKAGINKRPDTVVRQDLARQNALIRDYVQDWTKNNAPTDAEVEQEYEKIKTSLGDQKEFHVRHILLKTEQEAKTAISNLGKGAKFAELAKKSLDPGSRDNGGDLGWASPALFVPPFSQAMIGLSRGKYTTTPVKTSYGYHVILLEDVRDLQAPSLDEVKPELQQRLQQMKWQAYIEQLEKNADVK
ncbi:MAG: peptidylprolyl isomerase [Azoarcus sp.]|jgi:peptidyl-prolyl cis-trans isomerase C|nr:peptidylprolyl isomerase [Azoarcus sp.]